MGKLSLALLFIYALSVSADDWSLSGQFSRPVFPVDPDVILDSYSAGLKPDVHPANTVFRVSSAYHDNNQAGSLRYGLANTDAASYPGTGWESASADKRGWGMAWDLGVLYEGEPVVNLNVSCSPGLTAGQCASLATDVEAESMELRSGIAQQKWYPVFSLGVLYRF
jgi:hypothetical protein